MAPITHIVIFQYKSGTTIKEKQDISSAFLALRLLCIAPVDPNFVSPGKPYIQCLKAGSNNSKEAAAKDYEHGYVVTFASPEHRDYYVGLDPKYADPAHNMFKEMVKQFVENVVVVDFSDGVWDDKDGNQTGNAISPT